VVSIWWHAWHSIRPGLSHPQPRANWRRRWVEEIAPAQTIVVAEDAGTVVGFAAADVSRGELTQIFVAPSLHLRGIGARLFAWAQTLMPRGFNLYTLAENHGSRAFYRRHGLVEGARRSNAVNDLEQLEYLWRPEGGPMTTPRAVSFTAAASVFVVQDVLRSVEHYRDVLGFRTEFTYGEPTFYAGVERDHLSIHFQAAGETKRLPGQSAVYVFVTDVDALYAELKERGARLVSEPKDYPYGMRDFDLVDLDGNQLSFGMESRTGG
jgi:ribosomal protein S18 acetylase RimI-like enzyme/uncharacterized glyoxalase superfamily protein PhnB